MNGPSTTVRRKSTEAVGAAHPLAKACDQCHRCKVACGGEKPVCNRCARNVSACTYSLGRPMGKPRARRSRSQVEGVSVECQIGVQPEGPAALVVDEQNTPRKRRSENEELLSHKRHRSSTDLSISSESSIAYVSEPSASTKHLSSTSSLPTTCDTEQTLHDLGPATFTIQDHSSSTSDAPRNLDCSEAFPVSSEQWELDGFPFAISPPLDLPNSSLSLSHVPPLLPVAINPNLAQLASEAAECNCASNLFRILPAMEEAKSRASLNDTIQVVRRAQAAITRLLECRDNAHESQDSMLSCIVLLNQMGTVSKSLCTMKNKLNAYTNLSVRICGLDISIGEDGVRRKILDAVITSQVHDAVALSEKLSQSVQGSLKEESKAMMALILSAKRELEAIASQGIV